MTSLGIPVFAMEAMDVTSAPDVESNNRSANVSRIEPPILRSSHAWDINSNIKEDAFEKRVEKLCGDFDSAFDKFDGDKLAGVAAATWVIPPESVKPVPKYSPLERTSKRISGSSVDEVAQRLSDCLRRRSIATLFSETRAKAKCTSEEGVEFSIKLYSVDNSSDIIVEVQRWCGDSVAFQSHYMALIDSAEGAGDENDVAVARAPPLAASPCPIGSDADFTLELARGMLTNKFHDVKYSALIGLSVLTDSTKVGVDKAVSNSMSVVSNNPLLSQLLSAVEEHGYSYQLKNGVLRVLYNCMKTLLIASHLDDIVDEHGWIQSTVKLLIDVVKDASSQPHDAVLALKCLECILRAASADTILLEHSDELVIQSAHSVGETFPPLESASLNVMRSLSCVG
uniref:Uncharacterized protein n=1 Tax=Leptocylindrus danicus TaxID=163516 RepID=A0A7S2K830_9STRA|eukprot:CAMPEP_0116034134 /NCGR_PEP_ID=MMETSP0321-20121206/19418_1 /TAXON_ID=163516 /ORGANISM="Leptocylindrus danicus var. danicus, Strain B650" /LENGTH=397 /DNA_ID=CAMNT_0003510371 /DNA_START=91 /DNA_END=1284 /DNA_ORIENTATION=+